MSDMHVHKKSKLNWNQTAKDYYDELIVICDRKEFEAMEATIKELENPWISVEDRLPPSCDLKFIRYENGGSDVGRYYEHSKNWLGSMLNLPVTHWMPIPEIKENTE
jgi:hypothetical protein